MGLGGYTCGGERNLTETMRVLIADDNPVDLMVVEKFFEGTGVVPLRASDGVTALEMLKNSRFDLLITDYEMPGLRGDELAIEARKVQPRIHIWCVTASIDLHEFSRCGELCELVIKKPFQYALFREAFIALR